MIPDPLALLSRVGAAEAILSAVDDLADHLPGDNAEQRLASFVLAFVGALTLTTVIAVLAVALGICL
ncbi:MAG: hypothetical protein QG661_3124 [Actinomycetota bacterium]|nr:hypothetical protein [Actinomycetota bacterium]